MIEKSGLYKELDDKINETFENVKENIRRSSYDYKEDYNNTKYQIEAFYIYKNFIEEYLPKVIREAINEGFSSLITKYEEDYLNKETAMEMLVSLNFYVIKGKVEDNIKKDYFLVDKNVFYYFIDYLMRMIKRTKMEYYNKPSYLPRSFNNSPGYCYDIYSFDVYTSIKKLIDCYYNELQAIEMIEEEINLLKEDYHLTDDDVSNGLIRKNN